MELERWKKSSHSNANGGCVELDGKRVRVRDSKNPDGPRLVFTRPDALIAFVRAVADDQMQIDR